MTRITLTELKQAIAGTIIMNENLQNAFDNIYNAKGTEITENHAYRIPQKRFHHSTPPLYLEIRHILSARRHRV